MSLLSAKILRGDYFEWNTVSFDRAATTSFPTGLYMFLASLTVGDSILCFRDEVLGSVG
jgi:hypothetical protein